MNQLPFFNLTNEVTLVLTNMIYYYFFFNRFLSNLYLELPVFEIITLTVTWHKMNWKLAN